MAENLRLRVVLDMAERVLAPLKSIQKGSSDAAKALKATRDRLAELNAQQAAVANVQKQQAEFARLNNQLKIKQSLLDGLRNSGAANATQIKREEGAVRKLTEALEVQRAAAGKARAALNAMGITGNLSAAQARLKADIDNTTGAMARQRAELQRLAEHQKKLAALNDKHGKAMLHTGMVAAGSAAVMAAGNKMTGPLRSVVGAFIPAENAETQLRASLMNNTGAVGPEYKQILDLATRLGDRLPGTTAEFIDMMTMLRRQGMTSQAILGGMGESAAYLGIQLRMPVTAAAEFAAKMQDATQTAEGDMMGLMDTIQRAFYLGVDPTNMLQGFKNMGAVMPFLGKKGLEASQQLAPLLVMMDQAGMAGEAAGNAIRKVVQLSLDSEKLAKTNKMLGADGIQLEFATPEGKFAGLDNLFMQLDKLKGVDSDVKRIAAMKKLFGDDSETHQVLNTLMEKGMAGYREVVAKMQAQADLRRRVDEQLKTVSAAAETAQGSFTNMLKDMGATIAPDLVLILSKLGDMASSIGAWTRENQTAVKWALRLVGFLSVLAIGAGTLGLAIASVLGPMMIARFLMARFALTLAGAGPAAGAAAAGMGLLYRLGFMLGRAFAFVRGAALLLLGGVRALAVFLLANPLVAALALLAVAAYMVYSRWEEIATGGKMLWQDFTGWLGGLWTGFAGWLRGLWDGLASTAAGAWGRITASIGGAIDGGVMAWTARLLNFSPVGILWAAITTALGALGLSVPQEFRTLGGFIVDGLIGGIASRAAALRDAVVGLASSVGAWFREKLGIASPSRVFMEYGGWISQGAAIGMQNGQGAVRTAALALATAAAVPMQAAAAVPPVPPAVQAQATAAAPAGAVPPVAAMPPTAKAAQAMAPAQAMQATAGVATQEPRPPLRIDSRPPLMASGAAAPAASTTHINLTINAAPGMDERALARAVERAVAAELTRRDRAQRSRVLSSMSDID